MIYRVALAKRSFDQIRVIDTTGKEVVRVNNSSESPVIVEESELQNKANRDYFKEAITLEDGYYYISDMDLNIENEEVEIPHKPIIRISTPLFDSENQIMGILIINYNGFDILNNLDLQFKDAEYDFIEHYLINENGFYLYNLDANKTFSFMFEDVEQFNFKTENPTVFNELFDMHDGSFEFEDEIYYYQKINPTKEIINSNNDNCCWFFISDFNLDSLPIVKNYFIGYLSLVDIIILLSISCLLVYLIKVVYFRNRDREQLTLTTKIAENTNDAILITDKDTKIIFVNKAFKKITGYESEEVIGLKTNYFKSGLHSQDFYKKMWKSIRDKGHWSGEVWDRKKDGIFYPKSLDIHAVKTKYTDKIDKYIGIYSDLTRIKEDEANIDKLKNYNIETDLPNENLLKKLVDVSVLNHNNQTFGLFCFSIVNYNDLVFNKGNQEVTTNINEFLDSISELLYKEDFIAQISKNTFAIGLISYSNKTYIKAFCKLFFEKNNSRFVSEDKGVFFIIKAGISLYPEDDDNADGLLSSASIALEVAKKSKTSNYLFSSIKLKEKVSKELKMESLLRKAIINHELSVNYQPQVNIETGKIEGAEALMRWTSHELGSISPFFFIPIAEKDGFIIDIGYWLIERVFIDFKKNKKFFPDHFKMSINVSPVQFQDPNLVNKFTKLSEKYDVDLKNFEIEITESVLVFDVTKVNIKLQQFKKLGLSVALDDFGTGFSSLSYLKNLDFDKIKIDRSFIKDYPEADNGGIAKVIVQIAAEFNLRVITEGAETEEQVAYLKSIGCNYIQGYYYSKPLDYKNFTDYLITHI